MVYSTRRVFVCLPVCHFVLVFFSPFSIAITSLREERANLSAFRTFVRFVLVWICRFPLPLGVWEGLRFVNLSVSTSSWGLGRAAVCDCGTPWTSLLLFFFKVLLVRNHWTDNSITWRNVLLVTSTKIVKVITTRQKIWLLGAGFIFVLPETKVPISM